MVAELSCSQTSEPVADTMSISDENTSTLSNTDRSDRLQPVFTDGIPIICAPRVTQAGNDGTTHLDRALPTPSR